MSTQLDFVTGDWVVRVTQLQLEHRDSGEVIPLEPRLAALLISLASREGELATKEVLLEEVWQGAVVSDDSIAQAVSRLRKLLRDDPKSPKYVQTVWKTGYRWLSRIEKNDVKAAERTRAHYLLSAAAIVMLAVLIYLMFSGDKFATEPAFEVRTLTSKPGIESQAALSPDGSNVVYQHQQSNASENTLVMQDMAGSAATSLVESGRWFSPNFSADGNRLAFMQLTEHGCNILVRGLVSQQQTTVGDCSGAVFPDLAWHEQSETFALGIRPQPSKPVAIYIVDNEGNKKQVSQPPERAWGDFNPAISPDGNSLVFTRAYTEMQHDLFLLRLDDDSVEQRLTIQRAAIMGADWTPDASEIVFAARPRLGYRLYKLTLDGNQLSRLNLAVNEVIEPHIAANGDLVATQRHFDTDIYRVSSKSGEAEVLFDSTHWDLSPAIAPDGKTFAFTSNRNGLFQLWLGELVSGKARPLTDFDGNYVVAPAFSHDSRRLVFEVHDGDFSQIYTHDLASGLQLTLTDHPSINVMPSMSSDGSKLYFASDRSGSWQVWTKSLDGGDARQLTKEGGYAAMESPDGRWLYFNRRHEAGIWRMDLTTQSIELVTPLLGPDDVGAFAVVTDGVVYLDRSKGLFGVVNHIGRQGAVKTLWTLEKPIPRSDPVMSVSPELEYIYLVMNNSVDGDLIRVERAFPPP